MDQYELTFKYSKKGTDIIGRKTINIDLREYQNSYQGKVSQMQQSTRSEINKSTRSTKEQFIFECIARNLSDNEELVSLIDPLVDEIDEFVTTRKESFH